MKPTYGDAISICEALQSGIAACCTVGSTSVATVLEELRDAPFPCGYAESVVHDAVAGVRPVLIESALGMLTTDEARGIIVDLIRSVDEAEAR